MAEVIELRLNGRPTRVETDGERMLLWVLRVDLGLTGAKYGCGEGHCGACTVLLDEEAVRACVVPVRDVQGREVVTIEGLEGPDGALHPVQQALVDAGAIQCGFCTPGMVMRIVAFLDHHPEPTESEIARSIEGNLCRCTGYVKIHEATRNAARALASTEGEVVA